MLMLRSMFIDFTIVVFVVTMATTVGRGLEARVHFVETVESEGFAGHVGHRLAPFYPQCVSLELDPVQFFHCVKSILPFQEGDKATEAWDGIIVANSGDLEGGDGSKGRKLLKEGFLCDFVAEIAHVQVGAVGITAPSAPGRQITASSKTGPRTRA